MDGPPNMRDRLALKNALQDMGIGRAAAAFFAETFEDAPTVEATSEVSEDFLKRLASLTSSQASLAILGQDTPVVLFCDGKNNQFCQAL